MMLAEVLMVNPSNWIVVESHSNRAQLFCRGAAMVVFFLDAHSFAFPFGPEKKMSINVNCCEGLSVQKILCACHWSKKKPEAKEQVVYTDRNEQIVILSTPHIEVPDLVLYHDIHNTDVAVFSLDHDNDVRFASLHGRNLFQSIDLHSLPPPLQFMPSSTHTPTAADHGAEPSTLHRSERRPTVGEHKAHPSISTPEDVSGRLFKDVLPEYMLKFLLPICKQTLQGNFLQLTIMWNGLTQLVRTYPVLDYRRRIVAGMLTISPFVSAFNVDVNRFSVGHIVDTPPSTATAVSGGAPDNPAVLGSIVVAPGAAAALGRPQPLAAAAAAHK